MVYILRENRASLFSVIWSQCSKPMQSKVKTADTFMSSRKLHNFLGCLRRLNIYCISSRLKALFIVCYTKPSYQFEYETDSAYLTRFKAIVATIKYYKGNIGDDLIPVHTKIVQNITNLDEDTHISGN